MRSLIIPLVTALFAASTHGQEINLGRTWEIAEPDPIEEAKRRAEALPPERLKPTHSYRHKLAAKDIARTEHNNVRIYSPEHVLSKTIYDKDGNVLYPEGFSFNPIQYMPRFQRRIIVIDESDAEVVKPFLKTSDVLIINQGDIGATSAVLKRRVDMLDILTAESMNITKVPVMINVDYDQFHYELHEFNPLEGIPL